MHLCGNAAGRCCRVACCRLWCTNRERFKALLLFVNPHASVLPTLQAPHQAQWRQAAGRHMLHSSGEAELSLTACQLASQLGTLSPWSVNALVHTPAWGCAALTRGHAAHGTPFACCWHGWDWPRPSPKWPASRGVSSHCAHLYGIDCVCRPRTRRYCCAGSATGMDNPGVLANPIALFKSTQYKAATAAARAVMSSRWVGLYWIG